jgi:hypothetical protein
MEAISNKKAVLIIDDSVDTLDFTDRKWDDTKSMAYINTTTTYHLADTHIISLDADNVLNKIKSLDDNNLSYCHDDEDPMMDLGDIFVASEHGTFHHSRSDGHPKHLAQYLRSSKIQSNTGFLLLRKVIQKHSDGLNGLNCHSYVTEDVHPLDLFSSFDIKSSITQPFHKHLEAMPNPSSPLIPCTSSEFPYTFAGSGSSNIFDYTYGDYNQCIDFQQSVLPGSFNFNYDYNAKTAKTSFNLITGVDCTNCYIFMGASLYVHMQYISNTGYFGLEADLIGGIGANVELQATDPTISSLYSGVLATGLGAVASITLYQGRHFQRFFVFFNI